MTMALAQTAESITSCASWKDRQYPWGHTELWRLASETGTTQPITLEYLSAGPTRYILPPARNYIFDADFTTAIKALPPGTPMFRDVESANLPAAVYDSHY